LSENTLVEVQRFSFVHEADLAASALDASGIESTVREQHLGGAVPELVSAVGGVVLLVRGDDLESARAILDHDQSASPPSRGAGDRGLENGSNCAECGRDLPNAQTECPDCNSLPDRQTLTPRRTYWSIVKVKLVVVAATLLLIAVPTLWDSFMRVFGDVPEKTASMLFYGIVAVVLGIVLIKGLSSISDRRL
jgi:uncharacterized protein YjeT (DUF2065 family)